MFPCEKLVNKVVRNKIRRTRRGETNQKAYLSSVPIEQWTPSYVGIMKTSDEQKKERRDRETHYLSGMSLVENIQAFWATHGLLGALQVTSLYTFVNIMLRMVQERGVVYASTYHKNLLRVIKNKWTTALPASEECKFFDDYLTSINTEAESACNNYVRRKDAIDPLRRQSNPSAATPQRVSRPMTPSTPPKGQNPAVLKPAKNYTSNQNSYQRTNNQSSGKAKGVGKTNSKSQLPKGERPCRFHGPAKGVTCQKGKDCGFKHVG